MNRTVRIRLLTIASVLAVMTPFSLGGAQARSSGAASHPHRTTVPMILRAQTPLVVSDGAARLLSAQPSSRSLVISVGLPLRNEPRLAAFITREESRSATPMSQAQFDARYGATHVQVLAVERWAKANEMHVIYQSADGLTITLSGTTAAIEHALRIQINRYALNGRRFYANASNPSVPPALGIQTILGLNSYNHVSDLLVRPDAVRANGFQPQDFRNAYDLAGHKTDGSFQTIGLTLWGPQVSNSDFASFAAITHDNKITSCNCTRADTIQWVQVDGAGTDKNSLPEEAMDVEYAHAMAQHSHLKYYLGVDSSDRSLADAISKAANDKSLHVVSDSWGGPFEGLKSPFVVSTTNSFMHAVAVGTTFYFSTGDTAFNSGCPKRDKQGNIVPCGGAPTYPSDSPYVVAVGGTNLQMNTNLSKYALETAWNFQTDDSGTGGSCAPYFKRPSWQTGVTGAATCSGRTQPDISADADPASGALVFVQGKAATIGGTSLAAPLVSGMAASTENFLSKRKKVMGFAAPEIYKLANSPQKNTYFHDVLCGWNGYPAGPGFDQATGVGSEDWFAYTEGFAGVSVPTTAPNTALCKNVSTATALNFPFTNCASTLICWPSPNTNDAQGTATASFVDNTSKNFFRQFHTTSYASNHFLGGFGQSANVQIGTDATPIGFWLGTYTSSKLTAH
ncbi:MAG TPA: S53 family peptidase, partial [Chloroflexota bacterium]|nr:S53 family peptidase [Chloroflexota bacterium]